MGQNASSNNLVVHKDNFVPGAPVVRGPDWASTHRASTDDDNGSAVGHLVSIDPITHLITVRWPNGTTRENYRGKTTGPFDLRYACKAEPLTATNFKANAFVARGPDWRWENQDGTGGGRAVSLTGDWVKVRWNNGTENSYRAGAEGKHDIVIFNDVNNNGSSSLSSSTNGNNNNASPTSNVPLPTLAENQPSPNNNNSGGVGTSSSNEPLIPEGCPVHCEGVVIGAKVVRGPDWNESDTSDRSGNGIILGIEDGSKVKVKWEDGTLKTYRAGPDFYDLIYAQATTATNNTVAGAKASHPRAGDVVNKDNYVANARVVRGPDWKWGNQDKLPGHLIELASDGNWARVRWVDKTANSYRIGAEGRYDLAFDVDATSIASNSSAAAAASTSSSSSSSSCVVTRTNFRKDAKVRRGPNWKWGNQDGQQGGVAVSIDADGWIRVKWNHSGATNSYRAGAEGAHDIEYVDPIPGASTVPSFTPATNNNNNVGGETGTGSRSNPTSVPSTSQQISTSNFHAGATVVRGPQWRYGDQDKSGNGKLVSVDGSGWAKVKWADGTSNGYRSGAENAYDVMYASASPSSTAPVAPSSVSNPVKKDNARVGGKVLRGPHWTWGNQDKAGPGTIESVDGAGWCKVRWPDGTTNSYRCGADGKSDLGYVDSASTTPQPGGAAMASSSSSTSAAPSSPTLPGTTNVTRANFVANAAVVRGPDWKWGEQDGKPPGEGKLISIDGDSWVRVSWNKTGIQNSYRAGVAGAHDIAYPGAAPPRPATSSAAATSSSDAIPKKEPKNGEKVCKDNFKGGMTISRGPDWKWGEQDKGGEGKTVSFDPQGWVKVQWSDGTINSYRAGASGAYDIVYGTRRSNSPKKDLPAAKPTDNPDEACVVCLTNLREYCCVPCGHVTLCPVCVADIEKSNNKKCPICREPYQMLMRIFK